MKNLREAWSDFYQDHSEVLAGHYPGLSLRRFLQEVGDLTRRDLDTASVLEFSELKKAFLQGQPFAYLLGSADFFQHSFFVNPSVLIPRPETEYMVELLVNEKKTYPLIADVGCGSGVILLSLLKAGFANRGVGFDLSAEALEISKVNALRLRLENQAEFKMSDRLKDNSLTYDAIISNPPYIKASAHKPLVQKTVDAHEPALALYLPDADYDTWFSEFFDQVRKALKPNGLFMMEGHELELRKQAQMLRTQGFTHVDVLKDLSGLDRYLKAI